MRCGAGVTAEAKMQAPSAARPKPVRAMLKSATAVGSPWKSCAVTKSRRTTAMPRRYAWVERRVRSTRAVGMPRG